jgi:2-hydroxychromene-2-carboxylate isomerase
MTIPRPILYYDLGSPYAYLASERAEAVLGVKPRLQPILVGGIFAERGYGSWAHTAERESRMAEVEERAGRYGLPPVCWPANWPDNTLRAMRAATWADQIGEGARFARVAFRRAFQDGADLSDLDEIVGVARSLGLAISELGNALEGQETKDALRAATEDAWSRGVVGVPCTEVAGEIYFGDDRLEEAADRLARPREKR